MKIISHYEFNQVILIPHRHAKEIFYIKDNYGKFQRNDHYGITEAHITIYLGSIEKARSGNSKYNGLSEDQSIGAVSGHEFVHGTNEEEIDKDIKSESSGKPRADDDREQAPRTVENEIIDESKHK